MYTLSSQIRNTAWFEYEWQEHVSVDYWGVFMTEATLFVALSLTNGFLDFVCLLLPNVETI